MKPPNVTPPPPVPSAQPTEQMVQSANISQQQPSNIQTTQIGQHHQISSPAPPSTNTITIHQQPQPQPHQPAPPTTLKDANNLNQVNLASQPIMTAQAIVVLKSTTISSHHEQQTPLALTTQPQSKISIQTPSSLQISQQQQQQQQQQQPPATSTVAPTNTITIQQHPTTNSMKDTNNAGRTNVAPQALITTQANIVTKTSTINSQQEQQAPLALITQPQSRPAAQTATSSPTPQIQQQPTQVPITTGAVNVKQDRFVCCLLDQGVQCDRIAGNASFSARIQKIVASKKMNFALDPAVRHTYICDHHKAVITVAKKSVPTARESKAAARNLAAAAAAAAANNVNANAIPNQHMNNYNEMSMNQTAIQHPVNLDLMANQGRLVNNHTGMLISMPIRPGTQIAHAHYGAAPHPNQVGRMDHAMMTPGNFDGAGGDSIPSGSGGIEVDLQQLQVNTLRRYKRHFRVQTRPGLNKMQLAESLKHHFRTLPIIEKEAITYFVYIVKSSRNKLDHNPKAD